MAFFVGEMEALGFGRQTQDSREPGAGSLEPGARHIEVETSDGQTSDAWLAFCAHQAGGRFLWTVRE